MPAATSSIAATGCHRATHYDNRSSRLYIVDKQETRRKTAPDQANQRCPLTDHKAVPMMFQRSTKVLGYAIVAPHTIGAGAEHIIVLRDTPVGRPALRRYRTVRVLRTPAR